MSDPSGPSLEYEPPADRASDRQPFSRVALLLALYVPMGVALITIVIFVVVFAQRSMPLWVWPTIGLVFLLPPTIVALAFLRRGGRRER